MRVSADRIVTISLVACAVACTAFVGMRELGYLGTKSSVQPTKEKNWRDYASEGTIVGDSAAALTIVEFSDFQCPFCRQFAVFTDSLEALGIRFKIVYRHLPIPAHTQARLAAGAFECAAEQGRAVEMHRAIFAHSDSLSPATFTALAMKSRVSDTAKFGQCLTGSRVDSILVRDSVAASRLKVRGTPTLLIGSQRLNGLPVFDSLKAFIARASATAP